MDEFEDMILPDDFDLSTEETGADTTPTDTDVETESAEPSRETEQAEPTSPFLKVKYNKEEMELDEERARELAQKGLNYDKVQERLQALESDPRLGFIEQLANQYGMTPQEYMQAVQQQQEQARLDELVQQNIPEEYAREMLENRKFRDQIETERRTKAEEEKKNAEFNDFFQYFQQANGRDFNAQQDEIPKDVWEANANGVPLRFAYMQHQNQQLTQQLQTLKQNESNAKKAPIRSVTNHGSTEVESEDDFLAGFNSI
jgi:hypothetical protein